MKKTLRFSVPIGAMQRTAVFTIRGVQMLYANPFRYLTSCATLEMINVA